MNFDSFVPHFEAALDRAYGRASPHYDPSHDVMHVKRVVTWARKLGQAENADPSVVVPAAWLHDLVAVSKGDPRRPQASRLSAAAAGELLQSIGYPVETIPAIEHAIEAHSFSAGIAPRTVEARVVQDADRLEALGAIGIARCFITAGLLKRPLYCEDDPFCSAREPDDGTYTIDHFFKKLLKLEATFQTEAGRREARVRTQRLRDYLDALSDEVSEASS